MKFKHRFYGIVEVTPQCMNLQKRMSIQTTKNDSKYVEYKGSIMEVSNDMLVRITT